MAKAKTILTVWEIRTNDVWGNARDGWEVNDSWVSDRHFELEIPVTTYSVGTPQEFDSASPTDRQIRKLWGPRASVDNGISDDLHLYIVTGSSEKPVGDMLCISHDSLSPIRKTQPAADPQPAADEDPDSIDPYSLRILRERGGCWAVYQNQDMSSADLGTIQYVPIGPQCACTFAQDHPPDGKAGFGWRFCFIGWADLTAGRIVRTHDKTQPAAYPVTETETK